MTEHKPHYEPDRTIFVPKTDVGATLRGERSPRSEQDAAFRSWAMADDNPVATWVIERHEARRLVEQLETAQKLVLRGQTREAEILRLEEQLEALRQERDELVALLASEPQA